MNANKSKKLLWKLGFNHIDYFSVFRKLNIDIDADADNDEKTNQIDGKHQHQQRSQGTEHQNIFIR